MNRKIDIEFTEEAAIEIPAVTTLVKKSEDGPGTRRRFWIGWQLFGAE